MARTVLTFTLRSRQERPIDEVVARVSEALSVRLQAGEHHQFAAHVGEAFAMSIALFRWGGPNGTKLFALEGAVEDAAFVTDRAGEFAAAQSVDISDAVASVLEVRGAGEWHRPTPEELAAHTEHSRRGER